MWWFIGSALALIGVLGLIFVVSGASDGLWLAFFFAAIAGQLVFLRSSRRSPSSATVPVSD